MFTDEARGSRLVTDVGMVGSRRLGDGDPFVRRNGDHTVVEVPLRYEAGAMKARVASDADEKVSGLAVIAPDAP